MAVDRALPAASTAASALSAAGDLQRDPVPGSGGLLLALVAPIRMLGTFSDLGRNLQAVVPFAEQDRTVPAEMVKPC
jgi:hypothetical protein